MDPTDQSHPIACLYMYSEHAIYSIIRVHCIFKCMRRHTSAHYTCICVSAAFLKMQALAERWGAGVETQKNLRGAIGGWGRVPFNETYAPSISTIYDGA